MTSVLNKCTDAGNISLFFSAFCPPCYYSFCLLVLFSVYSMSSLLHLFCLYSFFSAFISQPFSKLSLSISMSIRSCSPLSVLHVIRTPSLSFSFPPSRYYTKFLLMLLITPCSAPFSLIISSLSFLFSPFFFFSVFSTFFSPVRH